METTKGPKHTKELTGNPGFAPMERAIVLRRAAREPVRDEQVCGCCVPLVCFVV